MKYVIAFATSVIALLIVLFATPMILALNYCYAAVRIPWVILSNTGKEFKALIKDTWSQV